MDKAIAGAKVDSAEKASDSKALYDKVVKNAIAKAKKENKVVSAIKKVDKK